MSSKYNSELIDQLYQSSNDEMAADIANEMAEINDPIFIYPVFSAYKKFKQDPSCHYFLNVLISFKQPAATEILKKIIAEADLKSSEVIFLTDFCVENEYFPGKFTLKVEDNFYEEITPSADGYDIEPHLGYFLKIGEMNKIEQAVISAFEREDLKMDVRKISLRYLMKYNAKKYFQYYYDNYDTIKNKKSEIILAKELNKWKHGIIPKFKDKIIKEGSDMAREIIESKIKKDKISKQKKEAEEEKGIERKFSNIGVITEITAIRDRINTLTAGDDRFGFSLFDQTELLIKQAAGIDNKQELIAYCIDLRAIVQGIKKEWTNMEFLSKMPKELLVDTTRLEV